MKKLIILFTILGILNFAEDVQSILLKVKNAGNFKTQKAESEMKIIDSKGKETVMKFDVIYEKGESDNQLMRFTSPARLQGTAILSKGDSIWYYNKRSNRVRLLSKSAKKGSMMGSSFSYDDMNMDYVKDFTGEILEDKKQYYLLKLFPTDKDKSFKYLIVKIDKKLYLEEKIEYFDKNEVNYKTLEISGYDQIDKYWNPKEMTMYDKINNKKTVMISDNSTMEFDIEISKDQFSERKLKK